MNLGRRKAEQAVPTVESLAADAAAADKAHVVARDRLVEIDEEIEASVDVGERERLREERKLVEARRDDARDLHATLTERRDRLAREQQLAEFEPARRAIREGKALAAWHRQQAAEVEANLAAAEVALEDAEDRIRDPNPQLSSGGRWVVDELMRGGSPSADAEFRRLPRRERRLIEQRVEALNRQLGQAMERQREHAAASWEQAGITPVGFPQGAREITAATVPSEDRPPEPPYAKLG